MNGIVKTIAILVAAGLLAGCGDYKEELLIEIAPDETGFMLTLEGDTQSGQMRFESEEFLEQNKVATKRVSLPQRKRSTGRLWFHYEWIPTAVVIKLSRAPESREWTDDPSTGTSNRSEKLRVESLDSVGFAVGATIMAHISEGDASKFLYYFRGKQLEQIIDTNVRGFAQKFLSESFGALKLEECKQQKGRIFRECEIAIREQFSPMGITLDYFGASEGLTYENPEIQTAIDQQVQSEADIITARNEKLAQDERNLRLIAEAEARAAADVQQAEQEQKAQSIRNQTLIDQRTAEAQAAAAYFKERDGILLRLEVYEREKAAEARVAIGQNFNNIRLLPANSPLLLGLGENNPEAKDSR